MKRIVVLSKVLWHKHPMGGGHTTTEYTVLRDITDKALQKKLEEMNKPYRSRSWEVIGDYHLTRKKDQFAYAEYCLKCAADPHCKDYDSKAVGEKMMNSILSD